MTATAAQPPEFLAPDIVFWEIAAEPGGVFWPLWREQGVVSIGWNDFGDMRLFQPTASGGPPPAFDALANRNYQANNAQNGCYQAWNFATQVRRGHIVFARAGWDGICGVGVVTGDYHFVSPPLVAGPHEHAHVIPVRWLPNSGRAYPSVNRQRRTLTRLERNNALLRWDQGGYEHAVQDRVDFPGSRNVILYGPPGTGKTWSVKDLASRFITGRDLASRQEVEQTWRWAIGAGRVEFVTFHPGMTYEEFVEGLKPTVTGGQGGEVGSIDYQVEDGVFKRIALRAIASGVPDEARGWEDLPDEAYEEEVGRRALAEYRGQLDFTGAPPFVLVLDEINRANVSRVLGELITLIEDDKRLGTGDEQVLTLPSSKEPFAVPPNLYLIGTMNTADRSIALLDVALRRRFTFVELIPDPLVLASMLTAAKVPGAFCTFVVAVFNRLNDRLSFLLDRDHLVGHAWFRSATNMEGLRRVFADRVIPLLQEYFQGDPGRLAVALGHPFEHSRPVPTTNEAEPGLLIVLRHPVEAVFSAAPGDLEDVLEVVVHPAFTGASGWCPPGEGAELDNWLQATFVRAFAVPPPEDDAKPEPGRST